MAFTSGSTAFGIFDSDPAFQTDADRLVKYVSVKLGGGLPALPGPDGEDQTHVQVELSSSDVYTCFEEACVEYGAIINANQAKSSLAAFLGSSTGSLEGGQNRYPRASLEWARRQSQAYGEEAYVGGDRPLYSGSIELKAGVQDYDLSALLNPTGSDGLPARIIVRQMMHFSPFASFRFFGTTAAINYLNGQFNFQSFTPESVFYMLPVWEDVLRGMQFETSNRVRRSHYSYELHGANNLLRIYPVPTQDNKLFFTYNLLDMSAFPLDPNDGMSYGVSNVSDIPFGTIQYSKINSIGRQWIWKMTLALSKEVLGLIRRKMMSVPIPGGDLQLDGSDMVNDARGEMDALRGELRDLLDQMSYDRLAAKEAEQAESLMRVLSGVPLKIYVG
ncbi:MAG TPA: hypothetical protein VFT74_18925 [Isosphaeraceae bacterium]|nr:hypothetical protein [Isosphaeraceae bacterium]